jgi:DegV family protein with EDD domain
MITITGHDIYSYIISGAKKLILHEKYLNRINVFPVADGDTGSNMAFTMKSIIRKSVKSISVEDTLKSISRSAMASSYGNSGTIVAGYFNGLTMSLANREQISEYEFVQGLSDSVDYAYQSISIPKEGTILTVMRAWGNYLTQNYPLKQNLKDLFEESIWHAHTVMNDSKSLLKELREADVVDAGAKGFVYFIEGIYEFLKNGTVDETAITEVLPTVIMPEHKEIGYRYCTEFILEPDEKYAKVLIENYLLSQGDSVIISDMSDYIKIHIHTDNPESSALFLREYGRIDMNIQYQIANHRKHAIGIITDSIADIPKSVLLDNQITVIPIQMIIDGRTYIDRVTLTSDNTYELIAESKVYPTSSQPSAQYIEKTIEYLTQHYDYVLGIFVSSKMSGTFDKVKRIVEQSHYDQVKIIDSKMNSGAQGLLVQAACKAIEAGQPFSQVYDTVVEKIDKIKLYVQIPDLSYATKCGRVPKVVGKVASLVQLKLIISIDEDGEGIVTKERSIAKKVKKYLTNGKIKQYGIVHSSNLDKAQKLADHMAEIIGETPVFIENVSAVVAAFIGKDAVGIVYEEV